MKQKDWKSDYEELVHELTDRFFGEFDSVVNHFTQEFGNTFGKKFHGIPPVNVFENSETYRLDVSAPGLVREAFKIELHNNMLTVSASRSADNTGFIRREFGFGHFKRTFRLPKTVNTDEIKAGYKEGVLHIHLPKFQEDDTTASTGRSINID